MTSISGFYSTARPPSPAETRQNAYQIVTVEAEQCEPFAISGAHPNRPNRVVPSTADV
jgi:hypothetical protein